VKAGPEHRRERIDARGEEALQLVALGELEVRESGLERERFLELRGQRPQPAGRAGRVAAGSDDVAEDHRAVHPRRLIDA
jgi:hypothetical protein